MTETWIFVGLAAAAAFVWHQLSGNGNGKPAGAPAGGSPFTMTNNVRSWRPEFTAQLADVLSRHDAALIAGGQGTDRTRELVAKGKGEKNALALVREVQAQGFLALSTTNLLGAGAKGIAWIQPDEVEARMKEGGAAKDGVALLPKL